MKERIFPTEEIDVQKMAGRAGLLHYRENFICLDQRVRKDVVV